jgi:hypothetical protein
VVRCSGWGTTASLGGGSGVELGVGAVEWAATTIFGCRSWFGGGAGNMRGRRRRAVRGGGGDDCQMGDGSELEMLERRQMADGNRVHALRS